MSHTTQCPACQTKFKVTDAHLALAAGMVRCGRCNHVFHAPSYFEAEQSVPPASSTTPPPAAAAPSASDLPRPLDDDFELELPDFQPDAEPQPAAEEVPAAPTQSAAEPMPAVAAEDFALPDFDLLNKPDTTPDTAGEPAISANFRAAAQDAEQGGRQQLAEFEQALAEALRPHKPAASTLTPIGSNPFDSEDKPEQPAASLPTDLPASGLDEPFDRANEPLPAMVPEREQPAADTAGSGRPWWQTMLLALLAVVLLLGLLAQMLFINRTRAAAELPELRPLLESACHALGCKVPLPGDRQLIRTEWSELSFVPGQDKLIQLNATLKNLALYPQDYPLMELTLKNASDQVLVRKVLQPQQYLASQDVKLGQFNANSEVKIQLRMEVTEGKAQGYSLDFYYH